MLVRTRAQQNLDRLQTITNMSTFTSRSATHEIPRQFFSALKSHAFDRLRDLANTEHEWSTITQAIQDWDQTAREAEVSEFKKNAPNAESHYRYSVLRTVKTMQHADGYNSLKMRAEDLDLIDLTSFFSAFMGKIAACPDVNADKSSFFKLSPTDRNLVAEDAFRSVLYAVANNIKSRLVSDASASHRSSRRTARSSIHSNRTERVVAQSSPEEIVRAEEIVRVEEIVRADDSVSVAPSEAISESPHQHTKLNAQILSLHNASVTQRDAASNIPEQFVQPSAVPIVEVPVPKTQEEEEAAATIHLDVPSVTSSRRKPKSKFSRSPPPAKKQHRTEVPRFFDTEVSASRSVSTRITTL